MARRTVRLDEDFSPIPGLQARMFAVPGKVALYLEEGEPELGLEGEQTIGIEFLVSGKRAYYIAFVGEFSKRRMLELQS
ncbi:hypothetical protein ACRQ1B_27310 [Rhizobium panacihumi]|uniref:hypothetical protein n=1 Tax=Rhizobium panacihumi TaxID=2008450 RepID=UPI003D7BBE7F